jgi:hypothetical protein
MPAGHPKRSVVAMNPLAALVPLLGLKAQGRNRAGRQPRETDGFPRLLAVAVGTILDPAQGRVDLRDQFPLPVAGAKFKSPISL